MPVVSFQLSRLLLEFTALHTFVKPALSRIFCTVRCHLSIC